MGNNEIVDIIKNTGHQKVRVAIVDIDGVLRGKLMHADKFLGAVTGGFGFCDVVFGWDIADVCYPGHSVTGWHTGYPDAQASIAPETLRRIPWEDGLPFVLADFGAASDRVSAVCPRSLLKRVVAECRQMGYEPRFSQEFEWFTFQAADNGAAPGGVPVPITTGMFGYSVLRASANSAYFNGLFDGLAGFGVPLEGLHTETGPGVYEAAIQAAEALEAADRAALLKTAVKEIAQNHGFRASFMAKWHTGLPGCGGHVHQSLWQAGGGPNLFYGQGQGLSPLLEHYIAGQLRCLPEILPMLAPTINSYKRLAGGDWAPNKANWGVENRTTALRVINGQAHHARLENRVPGADTNPYLAMAACLAAGLYGIKHALPLATPKTSGNGYQDPAAWDLPKDLAAATARMKQSDLARELFGGPFVDHFAYTREWECAQQAKVVTDWERNRYFEAI